MLNTVYSVELDITYSSATHVFVLFNYFSLIFVSAQIVLNK